MSANAKKEMQEVVRKLKGHGIECHQLPNGHWRTDSDPPLTFSYSPSDTNAARAAIRDIRKRLGIDIRAGGRKKGTADDFALQRLRERTLKQMERGATGADLARLAVWQSDEKNIGGWTGTNSAEVGIQSLLRGGRLVRQNHDALASALGRLEHASDAHFQDHLDRAADHFGMKRSRPKPPEAVRAEPVKAKPVVASDEVEKREHLATEKRIDPKLIAGNGSASLPAKVEITVKVELGTETRALIEKLVGL